MTTRQKTGLRKFFSCKKIDALWAQEAEDRLDAFEQGKIKAIPAAQVFKRILNRLIDEGIASGKAIDGEKAFAQIRAYTGKRKKEMFAKAIKSIKAA